MAGINNAMQTTKTSCVNELMSEPELKLLPEQPCWFVTVATQGIRNIPFFNCWLLNSGPL